MPVLLVLVGLPGSGKSTLARQFEAHGWQVVSQDELGSRKQCEAACWQALESGRSVVVDRCNHNMEQRRHWVDIALRQRQRGRHGPLRLLALCLSLPVEVCLQRAVARGEHATLPAAQAEPVIGRFLSEWQQVHQAREGFDQVLLVQTSQEAAAAAAQLLAQQQQQLAQLPMAAAAGSMPGEVVLTVAPGASGMGVPAGAPQAWVQASMLLQAPPQQAWQQPQQPQQQAWQQPQQGWQQAWQQRQQPQQQAWQQPQQAWQQLQRGWQQQPHQYHGFQLQQRQTYTSQADAADNWRRGGGQPAAQGPGDVQQGEQRGPWRGSPSQHREQPAQAGGGSNIVAFPGRRPRSPRSLRHPQHHHHLPRRHPWQKHSHEEPSGMVLDADLAEADRAKIVLMFDANGTITSHTSMRRSAGIHEARPGIHHLRRLQDKFIVGMFSSASSRTVDVALKLLEDAAGPGEPLFNSRFVLCRSHTMLAPQAHVASGGKAWDTVKPLRPYFSRVHRVILLDDDSFKACPGEERNLLLVPCWEGDDRSDTVLEQLVDVLMQLAARVEGDPEADVRELTVEASEQLRQLVAAGRAAQGPAPTDPAVSAAAEAEQAEAEDAPEYAVAEDGRGPTDASRLKEGPELTAGAEVEAAVQPCR